MTEVNFLVKKGLTVPKGSATTPAIIFDAGDTNTGIYSPGADQVAISTNGTQRLTTDTAAVTSTLPVVHPLGAAATPSLTFTGDLNTGIYSPGADQVAVATNGTGRLFIDATGNVGVGQASPAVYFDIFKSGATQADLRIRNGTSGLNLAIKTDGTADISNVLDYPISFTTGTSPTEKLRITSAGLVGIGTSSPGAMLDIIPVGLNTPFRITSNDSGVIYKSSSAANKRFQLFFQDNSGTQTAKIGADISGANASNLQFVAGSGATPQVTLNSSGQVGIGTTSVSRLLHISAASGDTAARIQTATSGAFLEFQDSATTAGRQPLIGAIGDNLVVYTSAGSYSERVRIDSSGRLLVGTSTSLHHNAQIQTAGAGYYGYNHFQFSNDAFAPTISVKKSRSASVGGNTIVQNGDRLGTFSFFGADGSTFLQGADITAFVDGTPGANDMPGRLVFSTTADGASSPTERMRISQNGTIKTYVQTSSATTECLACTSDWQVSGRTQFRVLSNGNAENINNSYGAISDIKLKENIVDANSQWDDLKALQVRNYNFKGGQTHTQIGLIAQEVELVSPGLVSESPDRDADGNDLGTVTKSVNYSVLYMKAVKALQEAMERIETLEAKVAALEAN